MSGEDPEAPVVGVRPPTVEEGGRIGCTGSGGPPAHVALLRLLSAAGVLGVCASFAGPPV